MKTIVISLGGSILFPTLEKNRLMAYAPILREIGERYRLFLVVGGGGDARRYIQVARDLRADEGTSDEIGILVTRLNARLLITALGQAAYPAVAETYGEAKRFGESGKIVVMGGISSGQTTDAVAAVLAEQVSASVFINATAVDGIYSADPERVQSAEHYDSLTADQLLGIVGGTSLKAGSHSVLDIVAARVVERSRIPLVVLDGRDPEKMRSAIFEGHFRGTVVSHNHARPLPLPDEG